MSQNKKLTELIEKFITLGEDRDELWFWEKYFEVMDEQDQEKLLENLEKEIRDLESLKQ